MARVSVIKMKNVISQRFYEMGNWTYVSNLLAASRSRKQ